MEAGRLVLLRIRRHDMAPPSHAPSVCIGALPIDYDHATALLAPRGAISFDVLFTKNRTAAWRSNDGFPQITAPLSSVLVSGIELRGGDRKLNHSNHTNTHIN